AALGRESLLEFADGMDARRRTIDDANTTVRRPPVERAITTQSFLVTVDAGPDRGRTLRIDGGMVTRALVGQSATCELRLTDRLVSRRHAAFELEGGRLRITDLGSTNGTRIGGIAVASAWLEGGEHVELGATSLRVAPGGTIARPLPAQTSFGRVV